MRKAALFKGGLSSYNVELWLARICRVASQQSMYIHHRANLHTMFSHGYEGSMNLEKGYLEPLLCITCVYMGA
jgi:hypothetical protein